MECWNVMNSIIPLFLLPRCLPCLNLCQGPGIAPCLSKNPQRPTTSWLRTLRPFSAFLWRNPRCLCAASKTARVFHWNLRNLRRTRPVLHLQCL